MLLDLYAPKNCPFNWWNEKINATGNEFLVPFVKRIFEQLTAKLASSFSEQFLTSEVEQVKKTNVTQEQWN